MRARTLATPEQEAAFRMRVGKRAKPAARRPMVDRRLSTSYAMYQLQLPIYVESKQANGLWQRIHEVASAQKYDVIKALCGVAGLMAQRHAVSALEFTRLSPRILDQDNLPGAFKAVLDGTCVSLVEGEKALDRLWITSSGKKRVRGKDIGHFDDQLIGKGRMTCHYAQQPHECDKSLHGIRIRFLLTLR